MESYKWAVIGAGPAGILSVGKLIDAGINPHEIIWIDPSFSVGDLGSKWSKVPSNTSVELFLAFLKDIKCINYSDYDYPLKNLEPDDTCQLSYMVTPLQYYTDTLLKEVKSLSSTVKRLSLNNQYWQVETSNSTFVAKNAILAIGAVEKELSLNDEIEHIPLEVALNPEKLQSSLNPDDNIAVFGSSHSAILVLKNLTDLKINSVFNFYLSPCRFALPMGDWILFDNTGLKGTAAKWAKANIHGQLPHNLKRFISNEENIQTYLPQCSKAISAVGFEPRSDIVIDGVNLQDYHPYTGIIAPGLFGLGIAYPELKVTPLGERDYQVGLWKFTNYINQVLPIWLTYSC